MISSSAAGRPAAQENSQQLSWVHQQLMVLSAMHVPQAPNFGNMPLTPALAGTLTAQSREGSSPALSPWQGFR